MKAIVQRVKSSSVSVDGKIIGNVEKGYNVLLGVMNGDKKEQAELLASKIAKLRIFEDEEGKMNLDILNIGGGILVVSQFTLCANIRKGNRPSFTDSAPPAEAEALYEYFCECLKNLGIGRVEHGEFGADMMVKIDNDGPVTIMMDTDIWDKR